MNVLIHHELTSKILAACFEVSNELGCGFLESVYEKALIIALQDMGLRAETQIPLRVEFREHPVGDFFADIIVEDKVLLELKAVKQLTQQHKAQVINYLKASGMEVGLLLNFAQPKLEYKRFLNDSSKNNQE